MRRVLVAIGALALLPGVAAAQDAGTCEDTTTRGPLFITPAFNGMAVTLGAQVRARYTEGYWSDPGIGADPAAAIELVRCDGDDPCSTGTPVSGTAQAIDDVLVFTPDEPLEPLTWYGGVAIGIDFPLEISFKTAAAGVFDTGPPTLGGIVDVRSQHVDESCASPDGGYRIDVEFNPATDDGPPGDIEYLLYLTRGPEVEAPERRARLRNFSTSGTITMAFVLDASEAVSPICVTVYATDGVGNVDDDTPPSCFDPIQGNFFAPLCSTTPAHRGSAALGAVVLLAPLLLLAVRRRR